MPSENDVKSWIGINNLLYGSSDVLVCQSFVRVFESFMHLAFLASCFVLVVGGHDDVGVSEPVSQIVRTAEYHYH